MNQTQLLTPVEGQWLLRLAREALEAGVRGQALPPVPADLPPRLWEPGAAFVTLRTKDTGRLRGCIGSIVATRPLVEDVRAHAVDAALHDPRFPPVTPAELPNLALEVSYLTPLQPLAYTSPEDLLAKLRPGVDGVLLRDGWRQATFLPQVWHSLPDPASFLTHLCMKMGAEPTCWQRPLEVFTYQVQAFQEPDYWEAD
ncbi:MAG: AmmeMemoRadiSam system protein A [Chloroflexi bacterium]|nr:AmmeMemoRadiSam system protein A [Chloroflexota bacterium]